MNIRKNIIRLLLFVLTGIALWFSFYTEPLSKKLRREDKGKFNAEAYVASQWERFPELEKSAMNVTNFTQLLHNNAKLLAERNGKILGVGSNIFFVIKGEGIISGLSPNEITITVNDNQWIIPIKHIFGNLARDASGWYDIDEFKTVMDFNAVSSVMNQYIIKKVLMPISSRMNLSDTIQFCAAVEVNRDFINNINEGSPFQDSPTLIPYSLKIKSKP